MVLEGGGLRSIRLGDREVLRRVDFVARDRNWGTVPATLSEVRVEEDGSSFVVRLGISYRRGEIALAGFGEIQGGPLGSIACRFRFRAESTFFRNRIGFCVLHPIRECAGRPCQVETIDGVAHARHFPDRISPHQPFRAIRAISHEVRPGVWAEVRLEGETFEMEDQRNWTDASFKTYGTPLDLPFPAKVPLGTIIEQAVTIQLSGPVLEAEPVDHPGPTRVRIGPSPRGAFPRIGLGMPSGAVTAPGSRERDRLRALRLDHLRLDLDLTRPDFADRLRDASAYAQDLGARLEVALIVSGAAAEQLAALRRAVEAVRPAIDAWLVFHSAEKATAERWVRQAREHLADLAPEAPIGAGSLAYFTEVNRGYPPVPPIDLVAYSINPQVHAFDDASLFETLAIQGETVANARTLAGGLPVAVTPITLRPRFNPNATGDEAMIDPGVLPPEVDPRQVSLLGASWTLGSLAALAAAGAERLTYYETEGWRGVLESEEGSPAPFPSEPGTVFPVYHVFDAVGPFAGALVRPAVSSDPEGVAALAIAVDDRLRVLVANLEDEPRRVRVEGLGRSVRVRVLDETNVLAATRSPEAFRSEVGAAVETADGAIDLDLNPYALARIDGRSSGGAA